MPPILATREPTACRENEIEREVSDQSNAAVLHTWFLITVGNISEVNTYTMEKPPLDADFPIRERKTLESCNSQF